MPLPRHGLVLALLLGAHGCTTGDAADPPIPPSPDGSSMGGGDSGIPADAPGGPSGPNCAELSTHASTECGTADGYATCLTNTPWGDQRVAARSCCPSADLAWCTDLEDALWDDDLATPSCRKLDQYRERSCGSLNWETCVRASPWGDQTALGERCCNNLASGYVWCDPCGQLSALVRGHCEAMASDWQACLDQLPADGVNEAAVGCCAESPTRPYCAAAIEAPSCEAIDNWIKTGCTDVAAACLLTSPWGDQRPALVRCCVDDDAAWTFCGGPSGPVDTIACDVVEDYSWDYCLDGEDVDWDLCFEYLGEDGLLPDTFDAAGCCTTGDYLWCA